MTVGGVVRESCSRHAAREQEPHAAPSACLKPLDLTLCCALAPAAGGRPLSPRTRRMQNITYYSWRDLRVGSMIKVYGRDVLLHDCDASTKQFYQVSPGPRHRAGCSYPIGFDAYLLVRLFLSGRSLLYRTCGFAACPNRQASSTAVR